MPLLFNPKLASTFLPLVLVSICPVPHIHACNAVKSNPLGQPADASAHGVILRPVSTSSARNCLSYILQRILMNDQYKVKCVGCEQDRALGVCISCFQQLTAALPGVS